MIRGHPRRPARFRRPAPGPARGGPSRSGEEGALESLRSRSSARSSSSASSAGRRQRAGLGRRSRSRSSRPATSPRPSASSTAQFIWDRSILKFFLVNVQLFLIAEVLILVFGLLLAVLRSLPGPVFFPLRFMSTVYVDVFRAMPGILVIYLLGFGIPALGIEGIADGRSSGRSSR